MIVLTCYPSKVSVHVCIESQRSNITSAGISIMALGALSEGIEVTIVPVGLNYFHAHKFRSRAVVEFGEPVDVPLELLRDFKDGKRRESIGALLKSIYQALAAVTVTAPDFETLKVSLHIISTILSLSN